MLYSNNIKLFVRMPSVLTILVTTVLYIYIYMDFISSEYDMISNFSILQCRPAKLVMRFDTFRSLQSLRHRSPYSFFCKEPTAFILDE